MFSRRFHRSSFAAALKAPSSASDRKQPLSLCCRFPSFSLFLPEKQNSIPAFTTFLQYTAKKRKTHSSSMLSLENTVRIFRFPFFPPNRTERREWHHLINRHPDHHNRLNSSYYRMPIQFAPVPVSVIKKQRTSRLKTCSLFYVQTCLPAFCLRTCLPASVISCCEYFLISLKLTERMLHQFSLQPLKASATPLQKTPAFRNYASSCIAICIMMAHSILFLKSSHPYSYTPRISPVA